MGLGGVGVTLQDLVQLYAGLARLGNASRCARSCERSAIRASARLMDQVAAWQVGNVLIGTPPPENAAHNRIAFKTGTSYGYRDAWSVGFDGSVTIGVWVGRPDGAPVPGLVGRTAAAPDPVRCLRPHRKAAGGAAEAAEGRVGRQQCQTAASVAPIPAGGGTGPHRSRAGAAHPVSAERLADRRRSRQEAVRRDAASRSPAACCRSPCWSTACRSGEIDGRRQRLVDPPGPGFARLTVIDAVGAADTVVIRIQ